MQTNRSGRAFSARSPESCATRNSPRLSRWLRKCGSDERNQRTTSAARDSSRRHGESNVWPVEGQDREGALSESPEAYRHGRTREYHEEAHAPEPFEEYQGRHSGEGRPATGFKRDA